MSDDRSAADVQRETLTLARALIACQSVTPSDGGSLDLIGVRLTAAGFLYERFDRGGVGNLWARWGQSPPIVCLAGHVDVVPPGPIDRWTSDPFKPVERDGLLFGRGAADMKASLAAMVTAAERIAHGRRHDRGSIAFVVTSDEEGAAVDGTSAVVDVLKSRGLQLDACIVGEPTSRDRLGDMMKNGRRGSLGGTLTVHGVQSHIAYPERGRNPVHQALPALAELVATEWDQGSQHFPPTSFQISTVRAGTGATNVIPGALEVLFNFRFSPTSPQETIEARVRAVLDRHRLEYELAWSLSGQPFLTPRGKLVELLGEAVREATGLTPERSTSGGTSDARFLAAVSKEIVEFGPVGESIHKVDEHVRVSDLAPLSIIYERTIRALFESAGSEPVSPGSR